MGRVGRQRRHSRGPVPPTPTRSNTKALGKRSATLGGGGAGWRVGWMRRQRRHSPNPGRVPHSPGHRGGTGHGGGRPGHHRPGCHRRGRAGAGHHRPRHHRPRPHRPRPHRPGCHRPGHHRPGCHRRGHHRPGCHRRGPHRPGTVDPATVDRGPRRPGMPGPGHHRPGCHRPGHHRPGCHRPGHHRPGSHRRGPHRPDIIIPATIPPSSRHAGAGASGPRQPRVALRLPWALVSDPFGVGNARLGDRCPTPAATCPPVRPVSPACPTPYSTLADPSWLRLTLPDLGQGGSRDCRGGCPARTSRGTRSARREPCCTRSRRGTRAPSPW